tara:strand:+ start:141 stop:1103 length:963 start_codon:yes stop_codon:yes gene_type:complete
LVKKNNFNKKTNNKKTNNKKTNNKKTAIIVITCAIISVFVFAMMLTSNSEISVSSTKTIPTMSDYVDNLSNSHTYFIPQTDSVFDHFLTYNDFTRYHNGNPSPNDGIRITFNESYDPQSLLDLKPNDGTVVIYPVFTSAAYKTPGFYDYYAGKCDKTCVTDISFENPEFQFTSSGASAQILYHLGYDFLTDIQVDKNPEILENYDTVILLHNEYVTKKEFNAISNHSNLIFLNPNALYAEIDVNYDDNTMTLIRGHDYPPENPVANGFGYAVEEKFHHYEYDIDCLEWKFIEIENGFHLNCFPESIIVNNLEILKKMKDL